MFLSVSLYNPPERRGAGGNEAEKRHAHTASRFGVWQISCRVAYLTLGAMGSCFKGKYRGPGRVGGRTPVERVVQGIRSDCPLQVVERERESQF